MQIDRHPIIISMALLNTSVNCNKPEQDRCKFQAYYTLSLIMTAKMGIYSAVNSLQWAMPQAKHIQMDSDLLETHTSGCISPRPHCFNCPLWRQSVTSLGMRGLVVCKILSFFEIVTLKYTMTKNWKLGTWHTGLPTCGFIDVIIHMVK